MLHQTPELDDADRRVLAEIEAFYTDLDRATGGLRADNRHFQWVGTLRKQLVAGAIRGSNTIEGYTVDAPAASALVAGSTMPGDVPVPTRDAVAGYRDALTWCLNSAALDFFAHSESVLSLLHFSMLRSVPGKRPGRYRNQGVIVTGSDAFTPAYTAPGADRVPGLMRELVEWLDTGDLDVPVLVRAAMAHLNLVRVHPWRDGNGRMSRCVQTLVIARSGMLAPEFCSIEEWLGHQINTLAYYQALQETGDTYQPERNVHDWVRFNLRAHHLQAQGVTKRLRFARQTWELLEAVATRHGLHQRTVTALHTAAVDYLRRETYQQDEGLSRDQAIRDIRKLEAAGLVEPVGYGATLYYVAAGEVRDIVEAVTVEIRRAAIEPYED